MSEPSLDFNFYVGGLEDGILAVLKTAMQAANLGIKDSGYASYSGQMESPEALKKAIGEQTLTYPLVLVGYAGGRDIRQPGTSAVLGRQMVFKHECGFSVVLADDHPGGHTPRRRDKTFEMIAVALNTLTGVRLKKMFEGEQYMLNTDVFVPDEVIPILGIPNVTAYGIAFETAFKWQSPDRTTEAVDVTELIVDVDSLNQASPRRQPPELPGVRAEVGS